MKQALRITLIITCLLAPLGGTTAMAGVTAALDRSQVALNETFTLTISKDGSSFFTDPDLAPLEQDFKLLSRSQSSNTQIINGAVSSTVSWTLLLAPRRTGTLQIPAITVGKETTRPLAITVNREAPPQTAANDQTIFLETQVDAQSVYVQAQVIYTLRVYVAVDLQLQAADLQIDDAVIEKLESTQYNKMVNGKSYRVVEQKFAIFPQISGTMEIPQMVIKATLPGQQRRTNFFDPFGALSAPGKTITLRSTSEKVIVKEKPPEYPAADWLPTTRLSIAEEWSRTPDNLQIGDSITMNIGLAAEGLLGTQLPPVILPETEGLKIYQSKAEVQNKPNGTGITGIRQESIALIPVRSGIVRLPEIRIPWWDKKNNTVQYAVLPAREINITGAPAENTPPPQGPVPAAPMAGPPAPVPTPPTGWLAFTAILAAAWLATLYLLLVTRRQLKTKSRGARQENSEPRELLEKEAFQTLKRACRRHDIHKARSAIISWARAFSPEAGIRTFTDIEQAGLGPGLAKLLREIDASLYGAESTGKEWQGDKLLEQVEEIREKKAARQRESEALQPLYR